MRLLLVGDLHVNEHHEFSYDEEFEGGVLPSRVVDCIRVIRRANKLAGKYDAQVVYMGDIFHDRYTLDVNIAQRIVKEIGPSAFVLRGNHDSYDDAGKTSNTGLLFGIQGKHNVGMTTVGDTTIYFLPYYLDPYSKLDKFLAAKPHINVGKHKVLIAHLHPDGAAVSGTELGNKTVPAKYKPLKQFDACFTGHIHYPQKIGYWNVTGASLQTNFGETEFKPRFVLYDTKAKKTSYIATKAPVFEVVECKTAKQLQAYHFMLKAHPNRYVRLILPDKLIGKCQKTLQAIRNTARGVRLESRISAPEGILRPDTPLTDLGALIRQYCEDQGVKNPKYLEVGSELVKGLSAERATGGVYELDRLRVKNFQSIKSLDFQFDNQIIQLRGPNGVGKSALIEAIYFALTGNTLRKARSSRVVRNGQSGCKVDLFLRRGKTVYRIVRSRQSGKASLKLWKNKKPVVLTGKYQDRTKALMNVLGFNEELLKHTTFLTTKTAPFNRLTEGAQRNLLVDSLIGASVLTKAKVNARQAANNASNELARTESKIEELGRTIKRDAKLIAEAESQHATQLARYKKDLARYNRNRRKGSKKLAKMRSLESSQKVLDRKIAKVSARHNVLSNRSHEYRHKLMEYSGRKSMQCPSCGVLIIGAKHIDKGVIETNIETLDGKLAVLQTRLSKYAESKKSIRRQTKELLEDAESFLGAVKPAKPKKGVVTSLKKLLSQRKKRRVKLSKARQRLSSRLNYLSFWVHAFGDEGLRQNVLRSSVGYIDTYLKRNAPSVGDIRASMTLEENKLVVEVMSPQGAKSYEECSDGQQSRFDLVLMGAMNDLAACYGVSTLDTVFLDERIALMDSEGQRQAVLMLKKTPRRYIVVSRDPSITVDVDRVVNVSCKGKVSKYE